MKETSKMDLAILGIGRFVQKRIIPIINHCTNVNLTSVISSKDCSNLFDTDVSVYSSLDSFLSFNPRGAIYICSPNYLHYKHSIKCLERGLHVLCEKPLSISSKETLDMVNYAKDSKRYLAVAHMLRYSPAVAEINRILKNNELGSVKKFNMTFKYNLPDGARTWSSDWNKSGGGVLIDAGIHCIDYIQNIFGDSLNLISSNLDIKNGEINKVDSDVSFSIKTENNVEGNIFLNSKAEYETFYEIYGSDFSLRCDNFANTWGEVTIKIYSIKDQKIEKIIKVDNSMVYRDQITDFIDNSIIADKIIDDYFPVNSIKLIEDIYKKNENI